MPRRIADPGPDLLVPVWVHECIVADWVDVAEQPPAWWDSGEWEWQRVGAFLRWQRACYRWRGDNVVTPAEWQAIDRELVPR